MLSKQLLLLSSSSVHGYEYLQYAAEDIQNFFTRNEVSRVLFIPYALHDHDRYYTKISAVLEKLNVAVDSIHKFNNPEEAVKEARAFFVGGGNTFLLLKCLYETNILKAIRERVLNGTPYIGTSAGTNVATVSIRTTNDMPIVYPPSFDALNLVPFNINPHFLDADVNSKHKGETREERILQYLQVEDAKTVLALREGSTLLVNGSLAFLKGINTARLYIKDQQPRDLEVGTDVSYLLN